MCHMDPSPGCQPTPVLSNPISSPHSPGLGPGSWPPALHPNPSCQLEPFSGVPTGVPGAWLRAHTARTQGAHLAEAAPLKVLPRDQLRAPAPQLWDQLKGLYGGGARAG